MSINYEMTSCEWKIFADIAAFESSYLALFQRADKDHFLKVGIK